MIVPRGPRASFFRTPTRWPNAMRIWTTLLLSASALILAARGAAQTPITRVQALDATLAHDPQLALARSEAAAARAGLALARAYENPVLTGAYTKDVPQYHATLDIPIAFPWVRGARVGAAQAARSAASYRLAAARAEMAFAVDTAYTRALVLAEHARLSRRTARDADSLLRMAVRRRDAGDASEMDVQLAMVNAGQLANAAADDSLAGTLALLDLQGLMNLSADHVTIALADTLALPPADSAADPPPSPPPPLAVQAARAELEAADRALALERRSVLGAPTVQVGIDWGDPSHEETGVLPVAGVSIPLPLFNRNRGAIASAAAARDRAQAALAIATRDAEGALARARRERTVAITKVARDRALLASANRVARMALTAYAEGEVALPSVLEAERNARAALAQYADDVAAALIADAALRRARVVGGAP
jgi:cobalt-zinc-cadmium efflux system outer membrane protein